MMKQEIVENGNNHHNKGTLNGSVYEHIIDESYEDDDVSEHKETDNDNRSH
jgi:hypothetical protein